MKPARGTLHTESSCDNQTARYRELLRAGEQRGGTKHLLRVRIDADTSYPSQSEAVVEHWDGGTWREVWRMLAQQVNTRELTILNRESGKYAIRYGAFDQDRDRLVDLALAILGPA